jgi:Spy/CpxP family protein refolding chaperone
MTPAERLQKMKETLGLTDEQAAKIKAIFETSRGKFAGLKGLKPEERRAKMREVIKGEMEEIAALLTPDQKEKWKAEMEKRRAEHGGRRGGAAQTSA